MGGKSKKKKKTKEGGRVLGGVDDDVVPPPRQDAEDPLADRKGDAPSKEKFGGDDGGFRNAERKST